MLVDSTPTARDMPPAAEASQVLTRARIRFRKEGDLRFLGHHDLMHCFERMFRRAELPLLSTRGFNPRPRLTFALSLALGHVGQREVLDIDLGASLSAEEIQYRLAAQSPVGLEISEVRLLGPKERAHVCRAVYHVEVPETHLGELPGRIEGLTASTHCWITRQRPQPRRCDIRPFLHHVRLVGRTLEMIVHVTPQGSARPEEIAHLLGLGSVLDAGAVITRSDLLLVEELAAGETNTYAGPFLDAPEDSKDHTISGLSTEHSGPASSHAMAPAERPTSLIPGPMSFDT